MPTTYIVQIRMSFTSTVTWYFIHRLQLISIAWHWYFLTHSLMNHVTQISNLQYIINLKEYVCHNKYVIPKGASQSNWSKIQIVEWNWVNFIVGEFLTQSIHCRLGRCGNLKDFSQKHMGYRKNVSVYRFDTRGWGIDVNCCLLAAR